MILFIFVAMGVLLSPVLLTFWQQIQPFDMWLLTHINQNWANGFFDAIFTLFRETLFWMPLYLFLLILSLVNFRKQALWWILAVILTAAVSDIVASHIIKATIWRTRPCEDSLVAMQLRFFISYCPRNSSFLSAHATTHFAQATFFFVTLKNVVRWRWLFFLWAFAIAYAQVYVGVHYPFDVLCGMLLGVAIGGLISRLFQRQIGTLTVS